MSQPQMDEYPDRISAEFVGKHIFLTGVTGFIGKVFVEKILRECPNVGGFYFLVRQKKGKDEKTRLDDVFAGPLFDKLKALHGKELLQKKCKVIIGDLKDVNLGISEEDRKFLTENIHYIYHIAASVRFDEPLKSALLLNTRSTKYMIELGKQCKKLEFFCHVSTAYAHPEEKYLQEIIYPAPDDPERVLTAFENIPEHAVSALEPALLKNLPNSYTFSKALSEELVARVMDELPIVICRPSIVIPTWKEPIEGWSDNINGPTGLLIGAGKGVVRTMYLSLDKYVDFIPVDLIANGLAAITWDFKTSKDKRIFNMTASDEVQLTWKEMLDLGKRIVGTTYPFNNVPWYPGGSPTNIKLLYYIKLVLFQILPAILVDIVLFCLGYKPVLCKIQRKIIKGYELLEYYANNQWNFCKDNIIQVRSKFNPLEKEKYNLSRDNFDMVKYFENAVHGSRLYILNETDDTLPAAKRHIKIMYVVDKVFKVLAMYGILYFCYKYILPLFLRILSV